MDHHSRFQRTSNSKHKPIPIVKYFSKLRSRPLSMKKEWVNLPTVPKKKQNTIKPGIFARSFAVNLIRGESSSSLPLKSPPSFRARLNNNLTYLVNKNVNTAPVCVGSHDLNPRRHEVPASPPNISDHNINSLFLEPMCDLNCDEVQAQQTMMTIASFKNIITSTPMPENIFNTSSTVLDEIAAPPKQNTPEYLKMVNATSDIAQRINSQYFKGSCKDHTQLFLKQLKNYSHRINNLQPPLEPLPRAAQTPYSTNIFHPEPSISKNYSFFHNQRTINNVTPVVIRDFGTFDEFINYQTPQKSFRFEECVDEEVLLFSPQFESVSVDENSAFDNEGELMNFDFSSKLF